jgi:hypothetical protein
LFPTSRCTTSLLLLPLLLPPSFPSPLLPPAQAAASVFKSMAPTVFKSTIATHSHSSSSSPFTCNGDAFLVAGGVGCLTSRRPALTSTLNVVGDQPPPAVRSEQGVERVVVVEEEEGGGVCGGGGMASES